MFGVWGLGFGVWGLGTKELRNKHADIMFKTSSSNYGTKETNIPYEKARGLDLSFTRHLLNSGMYTNQSLITVLDKERVINGSKDWMEKLN